MKVKLICKQENYQKYLQEIKDSQISFSDNDPDVYIIEKGFNIDMILGKERDEFVFIKAEDIIYFECFGNDVYCISVNGKYEVREKLYEVETLLFNQNFIRVNKSYVVNAKKIKSIKPSFNLKFILKMENNFEIDVTRTYYYQFKEYIGL